MGVLYCVHALFTPQVARLLLTWLAAFCVLPGVGAVKQIGTLRLYDTAVPRPPGITDPIEGSQYVTGYMSSGNIVWAYGALLMLDPKASTHVEWPESRKADAWHQARRHANSSLYPSPDVLFAACGPYILDGADQPFILRLAEHLGSISSPSTRAHVLALGLGINHAGFSRNTQYRLDVDIPSTQKCEQRVILNEPCIMNFTNSVNVFQVAKGSLSLLDVLEAHSAGYGVRGRLTRAVIARHGYTKAHILGCPSLFINRHHDLGSRLRRRYDALLEAHHSSDSVANLRIAYNIFQGEIPIMDRVMLQLIEHNEGSFVIVQEGPMLQQIHARIEKTLGHKFPERKIRFFYRIEDWLEALRSVDIQVGPKIHGAMAAIATETPLLLLPPDWRVQEMAESMALPALPICEWCQLTEWAANPTAKGLVTIAASTFHAEEFDKRRQKLACKNRDLFRAAGVPLHPEVMSLCPPGAIAHHASHTLQARP